MDKDEIDTKEVSQLIKINEKLGKLIELNVETRKEQVITNNLLAALCDSNDLIVTYKEQQKQGDKRSRKRSELYSKVGIGIALIGTVIALVAVYISITGLDGRVARFFTGLIGGL
jgi:hypothetical protein